MLMAVQSCEEIGKYGKMYLCIHVEREWEERKREGETERVGVGEVAGEGEV